MSAGEPKAVFLSYASQDAEAAKHICDALRAAGLEVWFDQNELVGGDAWDAKIRKQIAACALFVPIISSATQARDEGYFRFEWKLAVDRTHLMAHDKAFLLPVVIDATTDAAARVPPEFRAVQWTRLRPAGPGVQAREEPAFEAFCARVKTLLLSGAGASVVAGVADPGAKAPGSLPASARPATINPSRRRPWLVPGIAAFAILGAVGVWQPWKSPPSAAADPKSALADPKSVAVLAFTNMSADKDTEYFSDGVSEEILNALANNPALRVAGRTSSFSFKGKNATHGEIGRALNVARVIEGSVRKAGTKVRITVQLINTADSKVLWSQPFDKELTDIFAVQSEIATTVARKLAGGSPTSSPRVTVAAGAETKNLAAYDAYLRGRALQTGGMSRANALEMLRLYQEAVRLDPNYALAWARLSQAYSRIRTGGRDRSEQNAMDATNAAATALRLARALPEAHLAMASVHLFVDYDMDAAQRELDEAERLRPNDAEVPTYRVSLEEARGHWGDSFVRLIARAADRDPQNADHIYLLGRKLTLIGRYAEAEAMYQRALAISPIGSHNRRLAHNYVAWTGDTARASAIFDAAPPSELEILRWNRARLRAMHGDIPGAITNFEKVFGDATNPVWMRGYAAYYAAQLEQRRNNASRAKELFGTALSAARQSLVELPDDEFSASLLALVYAARGERSDAVAALEEAMRLAARTNNAMTISERRVERAEALMLLGDTDAAIAELRAVHESGRAFGYLLRRDVEWEPLRTHPKFQQLMKEAEAHADAQPRPKKT